MSDLAISAVDVTKSFKIHSERATSLKERLLRRGDHGPQLFHALSHVSIDIPRGHTIGLIGANGSGKSTLLKVLAGILRPTSGEVTTNGRIASLLELGAGFNSELSARDNIYLNASLLGLTRKETDGLFASIVDYSELGEFIDRPVKHYSSGMYVRLAFSVAVHVDPDILLVDEVLAVGDEAFARKCLETIAGFQRSGSTILLVSHDLALVEQMCDRAVVIDHGAVVFDGAPAFATGTLRGLLGTDDRDTAEVHEDPGLLLHEIVVSATAGGPPREDFLPGEPLFVRVGLDVQPGAFAAAASVSAVVMGAGGIPIWAMATDVEHPLPERPGRWTVEFSAVCPPIAGGFQVAAQVANPAGEAVAALVADRLFWVRSPHGVGLLHVPYDAAAAVA